MPNFLKRIKNVTLGPLGDLAGGAGDALSGAGSGLAAVAQHLRQWGEGVGDYVDQNAPALVTGLDAANRVSAGLPGISLPGIVRAVHGQNPNPYLPGPDDSYDAKDAVTRP